MNKSLTPFSFFHYIFIDRAKFNEAYLSEPVIQHEQVHSRELHSLDLLTAELVSALLWFNPFVFFLRNSIKENHEFLADYKVIKQGVDPVCYMVQLAREVFDNHLIGLTSNFNYSFTKKRLLMITKIDSSKHPIYRYLFILPVLALMLAFTKPVGNNNRILIETKTSGATSNSLVSPSIMPINKALVVTSSDFGWRVHPITKKNQFHNGIDLKADEGTPVMATADGVVVKCEFLQEGKGYGRVIMIRHDATFSTLYSQLSAFKVKINDQVKQGDVIGLVGHSGLSTGAHLHYEVIKNNKNVDPKEYFGN
jgi:hypothetical protein